MILAGQSHGAWISLESLGKGVKADAVVAAAPARHGSPPSREARQDFIQLLRDARSTTIPVVIALFADDSYDPGGRNVDVKSVLGSSNVPLHFIQHPGEIPGHSGSDNLKFNERFGACILRFVSTSPPAPGDCK